MSTLIELTGKFGKLTVLRRAGKSRQAAWLCRCECGAEKSVRGDSLRSGNTVSCGCWGRKRPVTHGGYGAPEYKIWNKMNQRCRNPRNAAWPSYGGRGICVCDRWTGPDGFANFRADMGQRPSPDHSLDRVDNDGGYGPGNCRWATWQEQNNNRRDNRRLTHDETTLTMAEWARRSGLKQTTLHARLRCGWTLERAITEPVRSWQ